MVSYLYNVPAGVIGDVSRPDLVEIEPIALGTPTPTAFGTAIKIVSGKAAKFEAADLGTVVYGLLIREVPAINGSSAEGFADSVPLAGQLAGVMVEGYAVVACAQGTPARGGQVYIRKTADTGKLVGDFETTADSGACEAIPGWVWASEGKDTANGNAAELRIKY